MQILMALLQRKGEFVLIQDSELYGHSTEQSNRIGNYSGFVGDKFKMISYAYNVM
jgi:hypothetical protein